MQNVLTNRSNAPEDESEPVSKPSLALHPGYQARHTRVGVWPLWDHNSVKKEGHVLSRIVQMLRPDFHDTSSGVSVYSALYLLFIYYVINIIKVRDAGIFARTEIVCGNVGGKKFENTGGFGSVSTPHLDI